MTPAQFMFSVVCFIHSSAMLTGFFAPISKQDSWAAVILGFTLCIPFLLVYISLMKRFPGKSLVGINDLVFGPVAGKVVSCMYLWFFLTLTSLNTRDLTNFVQKTIMQKTPDIIVFVFFIAICGWAVRHGIEAVVRYNVFFAIAAIGIAICATLFTSNLMRLDNFLPILDQPPIHYIHSGHIISTIPFGETVAFLMITPNIKLPKEKYGRYFLGGFAIGGAILLSVVLRDTAVLGNMMWHFSLPAFETFRVVNISQALSRIEILFAIILILLFFSKVIFLYYVTVLTTAQILRLDSLKPLVLSIGSFIIVYALILFFSSMQQAASGAQTAPFFWLVFELILPLITLVVAKLRGFPQKIHGKETGDCAQQGELSV